MRDHDAVIRKVYGISLRAVTDRIVRTYKKATPADLEEGASWYPRAAEHASDMANQSGRSKACCAAVISHLSPRNHWDRNVLGAHILLVDKEVMPGLMGRETGKARAAIEVDQNLEPVDESTFGQKTLRFYWNIMGDHESVTVDVWAMRAIGFDDSALSRVGVYNAIEYAYQLAARRLGVEPATLQAICWVVARGGRAA